MGQPGGRRNGREGQPFPQRAGREAVFRREGTIGRRKDSSRRRSRVTASLDAKNTTHAHTHRPSRARTARINPCCENAPTIRPRPFLIPHHRPTGEPHDGIAWGRSRNDRGRSLGPQRHPPPKKIKSLLSDNRSRSLETPFEVSTPSPMLTVCVARSHGTESMPRT